MQKQQYTRVALAFFTFAILTFATLSFPTATESVPVEVEKFEVIPLPVTEPIATATVPLKKKVQAAPALDPTLKRICSCESQGRPDREPRQFNADGSVLRGKINPKDVGMCQISETYWLDMANKLGYNLETSEGNIRMANYIYEKQGAKPWVWSVSCHGVY